ncbi:MAG: hypothetical protein H6922_04450 [Pseudomonadaceae bacterium]|nr:hypothetical protein [Pseudomonadaceae bacterium]
MSRSIRSWKNATIAGLAAVAAATTAAKPAHALIHWLLDKNLIVSAMEAIDAKQGQAGVEQAVRAIAARTGVPYDQLQGLAARASGWQGLACKWQHTTCRDEDQVKAAMVALGDDAKRRTVIEETINVAERLDVNPDAVQLMRAANGSIDACRGLTKEDELAGNGLSDEFYMGFAGTLNDARQMAGLQVRAYDVADLKESYPER